MPSILEWIEIVYSGVTLPLHLVVLAIIIIELRSNNRVNNSFYQICLVFGAVDLTCLVNNFLFYAFPRWNWLREAYIEAGDTGLHLGFFISWGLGISQVSLTLLMSINRFTALICAPMHNEIWGRERTGLIIALTQSGCLLFGSITFFSGVCIVETPDGQLMPKLLK